MYPKIVITEVHTVRGPLKNIRDASETYKKQQYFEPKECKDIVIEYITKEGLDRELCADPDE